MSAPQPAPDNNERSLTDCDPNRLAEALIQQDPPLLEDAREHIHHIIRTRLNQVDGGLRYDVQLIFDRVVTLPPAKGMRSMLILQRLGRMNIQRGNILASIRELSQSLDSSEQEHKQNEWGYMTVPVRVQDEESPEESGEITIDIDMQKADNLASEALTKILVQLAGIHDNRLRHELIDDCCAIIKLRFHLDFSTLMPQREDVLE